MSPRVRSQTNEARVSRWITLGEACKLLGVNESTLRRWADAGHIRSFRTPGGHRRFSEEDLHIMTAGQGVQENTMYSGLNQLTVGRIRRRLQRSRGQAAEWYQRIPDDERDRLRPLGRRLVTLASEYLAKGGRRARLVEEAKEIGREYGRQLAADGSSLHDAIEGFTFFRKSLDDSVIELVQRSNLTAEETVESWELLSGLADQVLLSIMEAFDKKAGTLTAVGSQ
ncbi:MAG TPA: helix-turn-helix domain-containing protein [Dehalococcoidia bacterium]|nr:helix-turn-helix domain-containing protein [Dehalococcoidia bacterium]